MLFLLVQEHGSWWEMNKLGASGVQTNTLFIVQTNILFMSIIYMFALYSLC